VNSKLAQGDIAGAMDSSQKAKMFCWIAFAVGLAASLIYLLFFSVFGEMLGELLAPAFVQAIREASANS
ncbi:MAG: CD225/dispanin family protein, partial [Thermoanaerobaculia bacterium]